MSPSPRLLRARWLGGRVAYRDAHALQRGLWEHGDGDWLLLLEHPHTYTMGVRAKAEHVLVDPASVGAELVRADRGGDVTYHGPGQLVGYPILDVAPGPNSTPCYVHGIEQLVIDALADLGLPGAARLDGYPGVWVGVDGPTPRKIAAIGVRVSKGRSMHGFALNVDPDMSYFGHIVPCGIADKPVTSMAAEGVAVSTREVVDAVVARAVSGWGYAGLDRQDTAWRVADSDLAAFTRGEGPGAPVPASAGGRQDRGEPVRLLGRLAQAGVDPSSGLAIEERKPEWLRVKAKMGAEYRALKRTVKELNLVTVCEEAGCPNIYECWADGTGTFMINGDRCTRACGFCLVDTRKPQAVDPDEPARVAEAVARMGLAHAVVTTVARDDLADDGASGFAATIEAIHATSPGTAVEVLISDCRGHEASLQTIFAARPEVLNHNLETVARLQRAVRPSASYTRSLGVLARAKAAGLTTKSGLIVGMGETFDEVLSALADLHGVGVDIVTVGQYLRPTSHHLPVARWWTPEEFDRLRVAGEAMGIPHVEASPLTRSSYHARQAADSARHAAGPVATDPGVASGSFR
ncbi:lipoyl synthase [Acidiferrimicrobium sp. IK]|uniref:lipoyl synthase n=1 Tax=Acidiferrimicrobium sp. IK TaxID=2871700 RepID=UPI0021CB884B|nr:lipoyl synthase [Acidiferrimicrobium sp. IK]